MVISSTDYGSLVVASVGISNQLELQLFNMPATYSELKLN